MAKPNYASSRARALCLPCTFLAPSLASAYYCNGETVSRLILLAAVIHIPSKLPHLQPSVQYSCATCHCTCAVLSRSSLLPMALWYGVCRTFIWPRTNDLAKFHICRDAENGSTYYGQPA